MRHVGKKREQMQTCSRTKDKYGGGARGGGSRPGSLEKTQPFWKKFKKRAGFIKGGAWRRRPAGLVRSGMNTSGCKKDVGGGGPWSVRTHGSTNLKVLERGKKGCAREKAKVGQESCHVRKTNRRVKKKSRKANRKLMRGGTFQRKIIAKAPVRSIKRFKKKEDKALVKVFEKVNTGAPGGRRACFQSTVWGGGDRGNSKKWAGEGAFCTLTRQGATGGKGKSGESICSGRAKGGEGRKATDLGKRKDRANGSPACVRAATKTR